jgi:hypothetical protein
MIESNPFNGVGVIGVAWAFNATASHVPAPVPGAAAAHAAAAHAIMPRKRRTAAATLASVNRGST